MDLLDKFYPSPEFILEQVDEYTLYSYYTEIEDLQTRTRYLSPIRREYLASWSFFGVVHPLYEFWWKDNGSGESGNIFDLILKIYPGLQTLSGVYIKIGQDFDLDTVSNVENPVKKILYKRPEFKKSSKIEIKSIEFTKTQLNFWNQFGIYRDRLDKFYVYNPEYIWYDIENPQAFPEIVRELCFAYRIGRYYQIYKPNQTKDLKFRNDMPSNYFFGYIQLPNYGEKLIIDKSFKDLIFCDVLNYSAISPKSETTMIPHEKMLELKYRFKKIYIMLDNDEAGKKAVEKYLDLYPDLIPVFLEEAKDKTDLCLKKGFDYTKKVLKQLL